MEAGPGGPRPSAHRGQASLKGSASFILQVICGRPQGTKSAFTLFGCFYFQPALRAAPRTGRRGLALTRSPWGP